MAENVVNDALEAARLALLSHNNCLITDRPDLPRSAEAGWTTDFSRELALIDAALELVPTTGALPDVVLTASPRRVLPPYLGNDDAVRFAGLGSGWQLRAAPSKSLAKLPPDGALPRPVDEP